MGASQYFHIQIAHVFVSCGSKFDWFRNINQYTQKGRATPLNTFTERVTIYLNVLILTSQTNTIDKNTSVRTNIEVQRKANCPCHLKYPSGKLSQLLQRATSSIHHSITANNISHHNGQNARLLNLNQQHSPFRSFGRCCGRSNGLTDLHVSDNICHSSISDTLGNWTSLKMFEMWAGLLTLPCPDSIDFSAEISDFNAELIVDTRSQYYCKH